MAKSEGSKKRLLSHFLANIGRVMDSVELKAVANGASEWARRTRELRDEQGYQILTHSDRADLKPGQYVMMTPERKHVAERAISKETRARVLDIYGSVCYVCGVMAGDFHPLTSKPAVLHMGHVIAKSHGGSDSISNLRPVCMVCNTGASNISPELPTSKRIIAEIRKAPLVEQKKIYQWMVDKFKQDQ